MTRIPSSPDLSSAPASPAPAGRGARPAARLGRAGWGLLLAAGLGLLAAGCGSGSSDAAGGGGSPDPGGDGEPTTPPANLSYQGGSFFLALDAPLAPVAPTVEGVATSFQVAPALPAGVTIDPVTGILAGTPTERVSRKRFLVTASNSLGHTTGAVEVEIAGPTRFAYVTNSGDDTLSIYAVEPDSGRLHFHGYHAQPAGQAGPGPLAVHRLGIAAYVANEGSNSLSVHRLNGTTGRVQSTSVHALGAGPHALALLASGRFLYASSEGAGRIDGFAVDAQDGTLVPTGPPLATNAAPSHLLADPMGRFLVALNRVAGTASSFLVDGQTGALTAAGTWPLGAGTVAGAVLAPSGQALYVTMEGSDSIEHFAVNPTTGELHQGAALPTGGDPAPPTIHPTGKFVYVPDLVAGSLSRYSVNLSTGQLTPQGSFSVTTGANRVTFDSLGEFAYSLNEAENSIVTFRCEQTTGELEELESRRTRQTPAALSFAPGDDALQVRASHLYVTNHGNDNVYGFVVNPTTGLLSAGPTAPAGDGPVDVALDPLGRYAFVVSENSRQIHSYTVQANGGLTALGTPIALTGVPTSIAVDPSGRWAFVTDVTANQVRRYSIAEQGSPGPVLTFADASGVGTYPRSVEVDPTGQTVYVVNRDGGGLSQFSIHPLTGAVSQMPNATAIAHPTNMCFAPGGDQAYATLSSGHIVLPYDLDAHTGELDYVAPGTRALNEPFDVEVTVSGRFCYTVMYDPGILSGLLVFDVREGDGALWNADTGGLEPTGYVLTGTRPIDIASTPDERFVYVVNEGSFSVTALSVNSADGQLAVVQDILTGVSPNSVEMAVRVQ